MSKGRQSSEIVGVAGPVTTPSALLWLALTTKRSTARKPVNWRQLLEDASIPEPPGYRETVELCLSKNAGTVTKSAAPKKASRAKPSTTASRRAVAKRSSTVDVDNSQATLL